jgi:hypothetical protein
LSRARRPSSFPLLQLLLLVGVAEVAINRVAVEGLRPGSAVHHIGGGAIAPPPSVPTWHALLSWVGLFLYYFASTLALGALAIRAVDGLRAAPADRARLMPRAIALAALAVVGAFSIATPPSDFTRFLLETLFVLAVVVTVGGAVLASTDLAASVGAILFASPLLIHFYGTIFKRSLMTPDGLVDSDLPETVQRYGLIAACIAAIASPYCFAPRPLHRHLPRPVPLIVGLTVLSAGAFMVREMYAKALFLAQNAIGVDLGPGIPPSEMALMLLALATLAWTLTSCALSPSEPRREVGLGVGLIAMAGYGFAWPLAFLLGAAGLVAIGDALPRLGAERGGPRTPPIDDAAWQAYVAGLTAALRARNEKVTAVTTRRDDDTQSTVVVAERTDLRVEVRLERVAGALLCVDVLCGADVRDDEPAALTLAARGEGWMAPGSHPEPPPAEPPIRTGDDSFDRRFDCHGDGKLLEALFDEGLRARAAAAVDGWIAYWPVRALRWRLYPGLGAPLDHPVPVSDLVLKRAGSGAADRLASVVDLICEIAGRGDVAKPTPAAEPEHLA